MRRIVEATKQYPAIFDSFEMAEYVLSRHNSVVCSVSGGSDSDILVDILTKLDPERTITYVWFDTGVEYGATKEHLLFLEEKYGIQIVRQRAYMPIPLVVKKYGQPFISKFVSKCMERLQKSGFQWEDEPFDKLVEKYPKCTAQLKWWCNQYNDGGKSVYNISNNGHLKQFIVQNHPWFNISAKCCDYAKKKTAHKFMSSGKYDLEITGVRVAEGGVRSRAYNQCYVSNKHRTDKWYPILWYSDKDKEEYCKLFGVSHSRCYTEYGFERTGCVCCPFSKNVIEELDVTEMYEGKLASAAKTIFKDSYEYTKMWKEFKSQVIWNYNHERHSRLRSIRCVETGRVFKRISDVYGEMGISIKSISNNLRGLSKSAGGYHWEYADGKGEDYGTWGVVHEKEEPVEAPRGSLRWRFENDKSRTDKE